MEAHCEHAANVALCLLPLTRKDIERNIHLEAFLGLVRGLVPEESSWTYPPVASPSE